MRPHRWLRWPRALASIRGRLLTLLVLATLPSIALVILNLRVAEQEAVERFQQRVEQLREVLRAHQAATIEAAIFTLGTLAQELKPEYRLGRDCNRLLRDVASLDPDRYPAIGLLDDEGRVTCASAAGILGASYADAGWFEALRRTRHFTVSRFLLDRITGVPVVVLAYPLFRQDGTLDGAVAASVPLDLFARRAFPAPQGSLVWLTDGAEDLLPLTEAAAAQSPPAPLPQLGSETRAFFASGSGGSRLFVAAAPLGPSLGLLVAEPATDGLHAAQVEALRRLAEFGSLFLAGLLVLGLGLGVTVVRPLQRLREDVARWRSGGTAFEAREFASAPDEVRDLAESFRRTTATLIANEQQLLQALQARDLVMAEMHHRVKNNLQIVSSLLNLQAQRIREPEARTEFEAARDRVRALATLHRHLYLHPDHETADLAAFIRELSGQLFQAMGERPDERIRLIVDAPNLVISSDQAVPLALVITEAVSSALTYGFPGRRRGTLEVKVTPEAGRARLSIRDDGVTGGLDRAAERRGLGGQLVRSLARQLGGALDVEAATGGGSVVTLDFPLRPPIARPPPAFKSRVTPSTPPAPSVPA